MIITDKEQLNQVSKKVDVEEGRNIAAQLHNVLAEYPGGIGLAAPQIGIFKRVFVIHLSGQELTFINPVIKKKENPLIVKESCLSFPKQTCEVIRYNNIITARDDPQYFGEHMSELLSIVFQHELDHLNGITILDKAINFL